MTDIFWWKIIGTSWLVALTLGVCLALYDPSAVDGDDVRPIKIGGQEIWIHHIGWTIMSACGIAILIGFIGLIW